MLIAEIKELDMTIKKVGVLGCGLMGSGIAQVSAVAGYDVTVLEQEQKFLDKGFAGIEKSLAKLAEKPEKSGITPEKAREARARIKGHNQPERSRRLRHHCGSDHRERGIEEEDVL